jgi:hypothetical protein
MPVKQFKIENPVDQFISQMSSSETEASATGPIPGKRQKTRIQDRPVTGKNGKELKRKRLNLLLLPSLYKDMEKLAYVKGVSVNETICKALAEYRDNEKRALDKYEKMIEMREDAHE